MLDLRLRTPQTVSYVRTFIILGLFHVLIKMCIILKSINILYVCIQ